MKFIMSTGQSDPDAIGKRAEGLEQWIESTAPFCATEQKHLDEGTPERAYWHYGYLMALRDVLTLLHANQTSYRPDTSNQTH